MGNTTVELNPDNHDEITINISGITTEQRRILKKCINYQDTIPNPQNPVQMIPNPIPLIAMLLMDSMVLRKEQMVAIIADENNAVAKAATELATTEVIESFV